MTDWTLTRFHAALVVRNAVLAGRAMKSEQGLHLGERLGRFA